VVALLAAVGVAAGIGVALAAPAAAHAFVLATEPGNWQVQENSPDRVSVRFSESVDLGLSGVRLIGPDGKDVTLGAPEHPEGKPETVIAKVPKKLANGTYTVAWHVISADSHPIQGAFSFSVGQPSGNAAPDSILAARAGPGSELAVLNSIFRGLSFVGFALFIGTAFFVAVCWPGGLARAGVRRLGWVGWGILLGSSILGLLAYGPYATGGSVSGMFDADLVSLALGTRMGAMLAVRILALVVIGAALSWFLRTATAEPGEPDLKRGGVVLGAGAALGVTWSAATHAAAGSWTWLAIPVDTVHLVAMAVWLGGLAVLATVLLRSGEAIAMQLAVPRFSRIALVCVAVLVGTGVYQAWREVRTPSALFGTSYGLVLVGKIALVVVLVGMGWFARRWVRRHYGFEAVTVTEKRRARRGPDPDATTRFQRLIVVEAAIAIALLGLTAVLVNSEPAAAAQTRANTVPARPVSSGPVNLAMPFDTGALTGKGQVAVSMLPGKVGKNELHISVLDDTARPLTVAEVTATLSAPDRGLGPMPVNLTYAGLPGHYISPETAISLPGSWVLAVTVRTSEVDQATVRLTMDVT
jgi:copper transport protein